MIVNIIGIFSICDFGLGTSLVRDLISQKHRADVLVSNVVVLMIGIFLVLLPFAIAVNFYLSDSGGNVILQCILLILFIVFFNVLGLIFDSILQSGNDFFTGRLLKSGKNILELVLLVWIAGYESIPWILVAVALINLSYLFLLFLRAKRQVRFCIRFRHFDFQVLKVQFRNSFWYFVSSIFYTVIFNTQVLLVGYVLGPVSVSKYILVSRFFDVVRLGSTNFVAVLFPRIAAMQASNDWLGIRQLFLVVWKRIALFSLLLGIALYFWGADFFVLWSGTSDQETLTFYKIFLIFIVLVIADNPPSVFLSALKYNKQSTQLAIFQGLMSLVLGYFLIKEFGILGIAISCIVSLCLTNLFFNPYWTLRKIEKQLSCV